MNGTRLIRRIEAASPWKIGLLAARGELPRVPADIAVAAERPNAVPGTLELAERLSYLLAWQGERVVGVASYLDRFDYHTMCDIREVVSIAGSRRAIVELLYFIKRGAEYDQRTMTGAIDGSNEQLGELLHLLGGRPMLTVWEA